MGTGIAARIRFSRVVQEFALPNPRYLTGMRPGSSGTRETIRGGTRTGEV